MPALFAVLSWFRSHPKTLAALLVLVAGAGGYSAGRLARPTTQTHEVVRTEVQYKDRVVYRDRVVEREAKARVVYRDVVRTVTVEREPTGATKTTTTITDRSKDATETHVDRTETATSDTTSSSTVKSSKDVMTIIGLDAGPKWAVRAFGTLELFGPAKPQGLADVTPLVLYGAGVDRRLWGPLWLGASGGGSYDLRSHANGWWVGVSVSGVFTF